MIGIAFFLCGGRATTPSMTLALTRIRTCTEKQILDANKCLFAITSSTPSHKPKIVGITDTTRTKNTILEYIIFFIITNLVDIYFYNRLSGFYSAALFLGCYYHKTSNLY